MWRTRDIGCQNNGEITYDDSSRIEPKRSHQWLTDISGPELFSNKKQVVEGADNRPGMEIPHMNLPPWHNSPSFHSITGQFTDRLFGPEHLQTANMISRNIPSMEGQNLDVGGKDFEGRYHSASTIGLSVSHNVDDTSSSVNFGGIRKVKVNQVQDFDRGMPEPQGHHYTERHLMGTAYGRSENDTISLGQASSNSDMNCISMVPFFGKEGRNYISTGQNSIQDGGHFISTSSIYDKGNGNVLSTCQPFDKGGENLISMGHPFQKADSNLISVGPSYNKEQENFISMASSYGKATEDLFPIGLSFQKGDGNMLSMGPSSNKLSGNLTFMVSGQDKGDSNNISIGHNFDKGESNNISFGGFHDETGMVPPGSIISSYDSIGNVAGNSKESGHKEIEENASAEMNNSPSVPKNKEPKTAKKVPPNTFPSNVKSLLSTGMFDGVPVKYYSWSREKNLKGIIKGTGYLCSCKDCNLTKVLNAYEFERHANCKTKHPNNHIYFENGKTIYGVVQELKNTPQEMLFDAIQNVTGSQINPKNFNTWKASYEAATRELQRIYGKDAVTLPS